MLLHGVLVCQPDPLYDWYLIDGGADASQYVIIQRVVQDAASSSSSSSTIFSAMYRFNYLCTPSQSQHLQTSFSAAANMIPMDHSMHHQQQKQDFPFDSMLHMPDDGFNLNDMMAFNSKTPQYFDLNPYMRQDWTTSSPAESVYPSPIDCSRPMPVVMNGSEHLLSAASSYSIEDVPNYVRFSVLCSPSFVCLILSLSH